jgi:hypothetical protein
MNPVNVLLFYSYLFYAVHNAPSLLYIPTRCLCFLQLTGKSKMYVDIFLAAERKKNTLFTFNISICTEMYVACILHSSLQKLQLYNIMPKQTF